MCRTHTPCVRCDRPDQPSYSSAGSRTVIDPNTATVEADEYSPVAVSSCNDIPPSDVLIELMCSFQVGQTTDLLLDSTKRPPEFYFTVSQLNVLRSVMAFLTMCLRPR